MLVVIHAILVLPQYGSRRLTSKSDLAGAKPVFIVAKGRKGNATEYGMKYRIIVK